jgi:hypothetical protein
LVIYLSKEFIANIAFGAPVAISIVDTYYSVNVKVALHSVAFALDQFSVCPHMSKSLMSIRSIVWFGLNSDQFGFSQLFVTVIGCDPMLVTSAGVLGICVPRPELPKLHAPSVSQIRPSTAVGAARVELVSLAGL